MYAVLFIIAIAVWAIWTAYQATTDQDYKQETKVEVNPSWPFPEAKRP